MFENQNAGSSFDVSKDVDVSSFGANPLPDVFGIVKAKLQQAASNPDLFSQVFGDKTNTAEFQLVISQWRVGDFGQLPSVQVISAADMNGADGAYASSTQKIYLSDSLFQSNAAPVNSIFGAVGVLVEETFHWLDDRVGVDIQGDEGELAKNLLFGVNLSSSEKLRINSESDYGIFDVSGQQLLVEMAAVSASATSLQTAQGIGVLGATSQVFTGSLGGSVSNNYLKFQVNSPSVFTADLSGLTRNVNLRLFNEQGSLLQGSYSTGTGTDSISRNLSAGIYYINLYREKSGEVVVALPGADVTSYSLKLSAPISLPIIPLATTPLVTGVASVAPGSVSTAPLPFVRVTSPNGGNSVLRGGVASITWLDNIAENVRIDLFKGGSFYRNITTSTPSTGSFNWIVPTDIVTNSASGTPNWVSLGSDYEIRIRSVTNSAVIDSSDARFSITGKQSNDLFGTLLVLNQSAVKAGGTVDYSYTVRNDGTDAVGASKVGLYLSSDAKSTTGDIFLGEINVGGLDAKSTSAVLKGTLTLPSQGNAFYKGDKSYFIKAVADYKNVIAETNEANNAGQLLGNDFGAISVTGTAALPIDLAGDTRATAKNLGTLTTSSVTFSDRIGKGDKEDFISFYVAEPLKASIEIKPTNVVSAGTIGFKLFYPSDVSNPYNSSGFYSTNTFNQDYIFNQVGWYYLQLGDTNNVVDAGYTLSVKTNSFVSDIGTLNRNLNAVGNSNKDLYRFKVDQNSIVKASTNLPNGISLKVKDSSYNDIGLRPDIGTTLKAGTYYLQTSPTYDPITYNPYTIPSSFALNLQATPTVRYDNAGFNNSSAFDLGNIVGLKSATDYIDRTDSFDYYSFTVGSKSSVSLNVVPIVGKATLGVSLYNDKNGSIRSASNSNGVPQTLIETLEAGKYYVQINNVQSDTDVQYRLDVSAQSLVANDAIGNSLSQGKDLGYLVPSNPVNLKDAIGGSDPADWMKFNVGTLGNVSTAFSGLTTPITLQLSRIEANGSLTSISTQNSSGQANWTPVFSNLVGNYALVVSSSNSTSTPYTLNLFTVSTNVVPTNVKWNFSGIYGSSQDVIVTGSVFDANGALDIDEARLYLQSKDGNFRQTFITKSFTQSVTDSKVANFSINLGKLPISQYIYQSDVYDKSRGYANTGTTIYLNGGYAAEVVYAPVDTAGETSDKARDLGNLSGTSVSVNEFVGLADLKDVFKFYVPKDSSIDNRTRVTFRLDGLSADADLSIRSLTNPNFFGGSNISSGTTPETVTVELSEGTYLAEVNLRDLKNTSYTLRATNSIPSSIALGQSANGTLTTSDVQSSTNVGYFYDDYLVTGFNGTKNVRVVVTGNGFTPNVDLYLTGISSDVKRPSTTNYSIGNKTYIEFAANASDRFVRVSSREVGATGSYTVETFEVITPVTPTPTPTPTPIPTPTPTPTSVANTFNYGGKTYQWISYTIKSGDTLSAISQKTLGDSSASGFNFIAQYNGISNPSKINAGQLIQIPQLVSSSPNPQPTPTPTPVTTQPIRSGTTTGGSGGNPGNGNILPAQPKLPTTYVSITSAYDQADGDRNVSFGGKIYVTGKASNAQKGLSFYLGGKALTGNVTFEKDSFYAVLSVDKSLFAGNGIYQLLKAVVSNENGYSDTVFTSPFTVFASGGGVASGSQSSSSSFQSVFKDSSSQSVAGASIEFGAKSKYEDLKGNQQFILDRFNSKVLANGSQVYSFDVYNLNYGEGLIEVRDAKGSLVELRPIEGIRIPTNIFDFGVGSFFRLGEFFTQGFGFGDPRNSLGNSTKTEIKDIVIPDGGTLTFTKVSENAYNYNLAKMGMDILFEIGLPMFFEEDKNLQRKLLSALVAKFAEEKILPSSSKLTTQSDVISYLKSGALEDFKEISNLAIEVLIEELPKFEYYILDVKNTLYSSAFKTNALQSLKLLSKSVKILSSIEYAENFAKLSNTGLQLLDFRYTSKVIESKYGSAFIYENS
ncbi:MAG: hypothetical protein DCE90_06845 [Pseudanabaena sp.]|nr:MAG: hypothetical protein DCE90_06845 [Pseudanabaena sp.]